MALTDDEEARLWQLQAAFQLGGGRGVELADEIDALVRKRERDYMTIEDPGGNLGLAWDPKLDIDVALEEIRVLVREFLDKEEPWNSALDASEAGLDLAQRFRALDNWIMAGGRGPLDWPLL